MGRKAHVGISLHLASEIRPAILVARSSRKYRGRRNDRFAAASAVPQKPANSEGKGQFRRKRGAVRRSEHVPYLLPAFLRLARPCAIRSSNSARFSTASASRADS